MEFIKTTEEQTLRESLLSKIAANNYYKFSTCDHRNWNSDEHYEAISLAGEWPEGFTLSYVNNYGVYDWVLMRNKFQ